MADRRLTQLQQIAKRTNVQLALFEEEDQNLQPGFIRQQLKPPHQLFGDSLGQRDVRCGCAKRSRLAQENRQELGSKSMFGREWWPLIRLDPASDRPAICPLASQQACGVHPQRHHHAHAMTQQGWEAVISRRLESATKTDVLRETADRKRQPRSPIRCGHFAAATGHDGSPTRPLGWLWDGEFRASRPVSPSGILNPHVLS